MTAIRKVEAEPAQARSRVPEAWPRGMRAAVAAAYVGMSESLFLREVKDSADKIIANRGRRSAGAMPAPVYLTPGCPVWLRDDLDAYLDEKAGRGAGGGAGEWMAAVRGGTGQ